MILLSFQLVRQLRSGLSRTILEHGFSTVRSLDHAREVVTHLRPGHIEWHLEAGLAVQFIEAPLQIQQRAINVPQSLFQQCAAQGLPASGNAAGHASATDLSGLPLGPFPQILDWEAKGIVAIAG